jgi:hypothetical protein
MHQVSSSMTARSQDLDDLSTRVGGTNLHGSSLGSLGSGTASSANNHIQHAAQAVGQAAETHRQRADRLKRTATNYEETEQRSAKRLRAISPERSDVEMAGPSQAGTSATGTTATGRPARQSAPGEHPALASRPTPYVKPPAWGPNGPTKDELNEFGNRWAEFHTRPTNNIDPSKIHELPPAEQQRIAQEETVFQDNHKKNLADLNERLQPLGFKVTRGAQEHDPLVKPITAKPGGGFKEGTPTTYQEFINGTEHRPPANHADAVQLAGWQQGHVPFNQLPQHLKDVALITHVAENGRNFGPHVSKFDNEVVNIANLPPDQRHQANAMWQQLAGRDNPSFVPAGQKVNEEVGFGRPIPQKWDNLPQDQQDARFEQRWQSEEKRIYGRPPSPEPDEEYTNEPLHRHDVTDPNRTWLPPGYTPPPGSNPPLNPYSHEDEPGSP